MNDRIDIKSGEIFSLPCVAMRDIVMFPGMLLHFDCARNISITALRKALEKDQRIFLTAQKDLVTEDPRAKDVFSVGVIAEIKQIVKTPDGRSRVMAEGLQKAKVLNLYLARDKYLEAEVKTLPNYSKEKYDEAEITALTRELKRLFAQYAEISPQMPKEIFTAILGAKTPKELLEGIMFNIAMPLEDKQRLLELKTVGEKLNELVLILSNEIEVLVLESQIQSQVNEQIDQNQKEYYLREQLRAIHKELGEDEEIEDEIHNYNQKIESLDLVDEVREKLTSEVKRLAKMPASSQEASVIRGYLDTCLELPWNTKTEDTTDIARAQKILDRDHYGLKKVKERILENLSVRALSNDVKGQIICLYGPPGVGKTSIAKSVAEALGRKYVRVSLGGVKDESDIRGHRKTYIGSMPGRIMAAIKQAGTKNPVILLDEIDKMSNDFRGDPSSAMLEVLDSEQNKEFRDHFIELPFDLSEVLFITTANNLDTVQPPLLDRMEVIELTSYTREEKFNIAKRHIIPKQVKKNGLNGSMIRFSNDVIYELIDSYTREAGVRKLERAIASLCRKAAKEIVEGNARRVSFTASNIEKFLGPKKYLPDIVSDEAQIGVVNGLAWTSVGGVIMPLEALVMDGKGNVTLTGSLGDVMKESAQIAVSYARSVADRFNIDKSFYSNKDIHIHAPEGAVPKDGPSAGVTMITAMISALSGIKVRSDVAMTGEITLRGKVLPIGGLREKTMAAYKVGIKTVIIPSANKPDLEEVDEVVRSSINFVYARTIDDVLDVALVKSDESALSVPIFPKPKASTKPVMTV
ncbi:MAG: endopeptidase La [Ruminococcus sp.]|nr:endopeptidase La [Ruminococcus sp.]